jgi:arabinofuranosyltransferase
VGAQGAGVRSGTVGPTVEAAPEREVVRLRDGRRPAGTRALSWALCAVPLVFLAERAWALRWMNDDGFITLRVVHQLVEGHGPVFNTGERVEAATSVMWVATLAAGDVVLPLRLEWVAVVLGIALMLAGVALALVAGRSVVGRLHPGAVFVPVGALVFVAVKPVWVFSSSGLEGGLVTAWLGASLWLLQRWAASDRPLPAASAVVLGLGPLVRPELALFSAAFLAAVLVGDRARGWRAGGRLLAWALALPVAYQVFRMGYYGVLVPNTAVAKEAGSSRWDLGWDYFRAFVDPYWLWLPVLVLALGAYVPLVADLRREGRWRHLLVVAAFVLGAALEVLYIVRLGGDYIESRLLLPAFFAVVAPVALVPVRPRYAGALLVVPWAVVSTLFLRSTIDDTTFANDNRVTTDDWGWGEGGPARTADFSGEPGVYYNGRLLPGVELRGGHTTVYASFGIGMSGYALRDVYVLDMLGLADPLTAHFRLDERGLSGHEKPIPTSWFVARVTQPGTELDEDDFGMFPLAFPALPLDHKDTDPFQERVAAARAALECPELRRFAASYSEPLTVGRFLRNVGDSFGNTALRIPSRPREAVERLCDGD